MTKVRASSLIIAALASLSPALADAASPTIEQLCAKAGCPPDAVQRVRAGKWVQLSPPESFDRDLAVGFIFLVKHPPSEAARGFRAGGDFSADPEVLASRRLGASVTLADFESLRLSPHGSDEARRYLTARPGNELNLSETELSSFTQLGDAASLADVETQLHQMLLARLQAYRAKGLDGMAPYLRAKGRSCQPGADLKQIVARIAPVIQEYMPAFNDLISNYPRSRPAGLDESYHWLVYQLDDRPTAVLRHRMTIPMGDAIAFVDREFYVGHGYDTMQVLGALFPAPEGTIVFYSAHTTTDQVAGASTSVKHSVGRRIMYKQLQKIFQHFQ